MKKFISILFVSLLVSTASFAVAENNKPLPKTNKIQEEPAAKNLGTPSVYFNNKNFYLEYVTGNNTQWLNEYRVKDGSSQDYQYLFTVHSFETVNKTPEQMAERLIASYQKQEEQIENYQTLNGNGEDFCISFIHPQENVLEFNLFRFTSENGHNAALQFIYREYIHNADYDAAAKKMQETINENLDIWENAIIDMQVPDIYHEITN